MHQNGSLKRHQYAKCRQKCCYTSRCKSQFSKVLPEYGMAMDMIVSLHQLIGDALVFESAQ